MTLTNDSDRLAGLRQAIEHGETKRVTEALAHLSSEDLGEVFSLTFKVRDQPYVELALLLWITEQPQPFPGSPRHTSWLRAMNNACLRASQLDDIDEHRALALAERSLAHAPANLSIYHNVACLYCKLDRRAQALHAVHAAAEHNYPRIGDLYDDTDLALIRDDPEFLRLVNPARESAQGRLEASLAELSRQCFRGRPLPAELAAVVSGEQRGLGLPGFLQSLVSAPPQLETLPSKLREFLLAHVDWFARTETVTWTDTTFELGYLRESMVAELPDAVARPSGTPRPVLWVAAKTGDMRVSATLWHALTLMADYAWSPPDMRQSLGIEASNLKVDPKALDLAIARAESQRLEDVVFRAVAEHVPCGEPDPQVVALADLARQLPNDGSSGKQTVYLLHSEARPWVAGQVSRSGGPPIGVDRHTRPRRPDGTFMAHILTIDLRDAPALRDHAAFRERPNTRAVALFMGAPLSWRATSLRIDPLEQTVLCLNEKDLARGEWNDEPVAELPRRRLSLTPIEVPAWLFASPPVKCGIDLALLWSLLTAAPYVGGESLVRSDDGGSLEDPFVLQFDQSVASIPGPIVTEGNGQRQLMYVVRANGIVLRWSGWRSHEDEPVWLAALGWPGCQLPWPTTEWHDFARGPDSMLEQTLIRMGGLSEGLFVLSFEFVDSDGTHIRFRLDQSEFDVQLEASSCQEGMEHIVGELNRTLSRVQVPWRFVVADLRKNFRMLLLSTGWLDRIPEHWRETTLSGLEPEFVCSTPPRPILQALPPAAPTVIDIVGPTRVFPRDPSYSALLAEYLADLGEFAGAANFEVTPRALDPNEGRVMHFSAKAENIHWTIRLPGASNVELDGTMNELNGWAMRGKRRRLYPYRIDVDRRGFVLASKDEAAALRRWGYLCEDWRRQFAHERLAKAGIELDRYRRGTLALRAVLTRMAYLGRDVAPMQATVGIQSIAVRVAEHECETELSDEARERELPSVLAELLPKINALLAKADSEHRWLLHHGPYLWRLVFVERRWAAQLAALFEPIAASLEPGFCYDGPAMLPIAYPRPSPDFAPPAMPRPQDLLPKKRIMESDFKCSSRTEDYPDLLKELADLASIQLEIEPCAVPDENASSYTVFATHGGIHHAVKIENHKYANVTPFLDFLNAILASQRNRFRLYRYYDANADGVVLATPNEAKTLVAAGYAYVDA